MRGFGNDCTRLAFVPTNVQGIVKSNHCSAVVMPPDAAKEK